MQEITHLLIINYIINDSITFFLQQQKISAAESGRSAAVLRQDQDRCSFPRSCANLWWNPAQSLFSPRRQCGFLTIGGNLNLQFYQNSCEWNGVTPEKCHPKTKVTCGNLCIVLISCTILVQSCCFLRSQALTLMYTLRNCPCKVTCCGVRLQKNAYYLGASSNIGAKLGFDSLPDTISYFQLSYFIVLSSDSWDKSVCPCQFTALLTASITFSLFQIKYQVYFTLQWKVPKM